jgi:uncharacterized protein YaiL (DUF2058 family)
MNKRLEIILETISNIFEEKKIATGTEAMRIAAKGNKKGKLPSKKKMARMTAKARQEEEIKALENAN